MSILIVLTTIVDWVLSSVRKLFRNIFLSMASGVICFTLFGWKIFNVTTVEKTEYNTDEDVLKETTLMAQIRADYCTDGMELQLRHFIGTKMQTRHNKAEPCAIAQGSQDE